MLKSEANNLKEQDLKLSLTFDISKVSDLLKRKVLESLPNDNTVKCKSKVHYIKLITNFYTQGASILHLETVTFN